MLLIWLVYKQKEQNTVRKRDRIERWLINIIWVSSNQNGSNDLCDEPCFPKTKEREGACLWVSLRAHFLILILICILSYW